MDLDLVTNGSKITDSINLLNSGKISWIVLGYANNTTIKVIETGSDSFEDMFEEFDANKIMYGFAAVTDPNTTLKKNVFIYWQGSAANQAMKTKSVQHSIVISNLCKPVHVTHNARDEQDLDLKEIMTKVASASGANYSCHKESKQIYQHDSSVKSEGNTAVNSREIRMRELSALGSIQKEPVPDQRISSNYEKVNAMTEIKKLRNQSVDEDSPHTAVGTNYTKVDAAKEIKSSILPNREHIPVGTNFTKVDAAKEIKSSLLPNKEQAPGYNLSPSYKRINVQQEFKSLNTNTKSLYENKAKVESENNTAQNVKEERQKELSKLFSKTASHDDYNDNKVGTNYKKVDPAAEIKKLRSGSISNENDDTVFRNTSSYKKIDPNAEIQQLRRNSSSEVNDPVSPGTNYKKINPAEEIKKLKSQNSVTDEQTPVRSYKKINPMEEIISARKASIGSEIHTAPPSSYRATTEQSVVKPAALLSARKSFDKVHKTNDIVQHPQSPRAVKANPMQVREDQSVKQSFFGESNIRKDDSGPIPPVNVPVNAPVATSSVTDKPKNSAEAQFDYLATDVDEISFSEGEIIRELDVIDDEWWTGINAAGQKGLFPSSYVMLSNIDQPKKEHQKNAPLTQIASPNNNSSNVKSPTALSNDQPRMDIKCSDTAIAIYDYQASGSDEISFDIGEILKEIDQVDEGWWVGINKAGHKGMFPANFVELVASEKDAGVVSSGHVKENNDSYQHPGNNSLTAKALFDYCAQDSDELTFYVGDMLYNVAIIDDGWWEGETANGIKGLFPSNYVETV